MMASDNMILTKAKTTTGTYDAASRAAFRHENAAQEQSSQFVTSDVNDSIVKLQLVLGLSLSEIAHVIWKHGIVVWNLRIEIAVTHKKIKP